jgi:hypothetical protein
VRKSFKIPDRFWHSCAAPSQIPSARPTNHLEIAQPTPFDCSARKRNRDSTARREGINSTAATRQEVRTRAHASGRHNGWLGREEHLLAGLGGMRTWPAGQDARMVAGKGAHGRLGRMRAWLLARERGAHGDRLWPEVGMAAS